MNRAELKADSYRSRNFSQQENLYLPESYNKYRLNGKEYIKYGIQGFGIVALIAYIFYRSGIAFFILLPAIIIIFRKKEKELVLKRKEELSLQFREMMHAVIAGLQAGYSIENAFTHAYQDISLLYGKDAMMAKELHYMAKAMRNNRNLEDLLSEFAVRSGVTDIRDFAEIFHIAKRSGGDLPGILKNTADIISDKMEVKREIITMMSAKRLEQSIMNVVPFLIILYIDVTSPGFFDCMYHNPVGIVIMTILLIIYIAAYLLAERIIRIEI